VILNQSRQTKQKVFSEADEQNFGLQGYLHEKENDTATWTPEAPAPDPSAFKGQISCRLVSGRRILGRGTKIFGSSAEFVGEERVRLARQVAWAWELAIRKGDLFA